MDVAVTGLGLVTPGGIGVEASWDAITNGKPTAAIDPSLDGCPVRISSLVPGFDADELFGARRALRMDRVTQLAVAAVNEALQDAGLDPRTWDGARVAVVLGSGQGGITTLDEQYALFAERGAKAISPLLLPKHLINMVAGVVSIEFNAAGPSLVTATACASGTTAIGMARDLLILDRCDIAVAGGSEGRLTPLYMSGFAQMKALSRRHDDPAAASRPFDADRDGFVAGEGAGILILERIADAQARKARIRGLITGYGASSDALHITSPHPEGAGAQSAVLAALRDAGATPGDVAHINAHGTATRQNDLAESVMLERNFPHHPYVTSTKGVTGHLLGAAGAVEAAFTVLAVEQGITPPTANLQTLDSDIHLNVPTTAVSTPVPLALSNSFGFGGHNAVLAIAPP
ncbi:3-oxoacyl-[acyl-carrier-protein] synthase II [Streptomyces sp. Ag109_O5-1]|uniref:beta-ketoacyl-[acyl-carrier-protein] synthase family protein n=1 Tax=Streptomyces sp. Ag109_O5-1 TaxID=1938851 RepID=UPI000F5073F0|nr:beta-ketoacyl-[acyl-carrier-protein] synthase family protein [Streptomyces sp. Ag109_O5-1]RPE39186.1 3-oxoacyl-[acyl-carrier-protein] synthase II [Streptomyces sp. Ag109_O5-1]